MRTAMFVFAPAITLASLLVSGPLQGANRTPQGVETVARAPRSIPGATCAVPEGEKRLVDARILRVVKGGDATVRVRRLLNEPIGVHLRRAFDQLEKLKGKKVNIDAAWGVSGYVKPKTNTLEPRTGSGARVVAASFSVTQFGFSDANTDLYWFPADSETNYWLGTFYATHYDENGEADVDEIINVEQQYGSGTWAATYQHVEYATDRIHGPYQVRWQSSQSNPVALLTKFDGVDGGRLLRAGLRFLGRYGDWLGCGASWCAGAAAGCGVANVWDAEIAWAPCTGAGCATGFIGCSWGTLWGV